MPIMSATGHVPRHGASLSNSAHSLTFVTDAVPFVLVMDAGKWASNMEGLQRSDESILRTLKNPPNKNGISYDTNKPYLLCASIYSDKTNIGNNQNAYPLHLVVGNWGVHEVNQLLSTNAGMLAYLPILPENSQIGAEAMTQLRSEFMQLCLDIVLRFVHTTTYISLRPPSLLRPDTLST